MTYEVHESAIVDEGAEIGDGSRISHFVRGLGRAVIGENVSMGQNRFVGNSAVIGDNFKIQNSGSDYDNVILEEGVFCGPSGVFTNVHNPRSLIERKSKFPDILVRRGATPGANCTVVCGVTIGQFAVIGAGTDVPDYALMVGLPARQVRAADQVTSLPMHPYLSEADQDAIAASLKSDIREP